MKRYLTLILFAVLLAGSAQSQTLFTTVGKPVDGMINTPDGHLVQAGSELELSEGTAPEGFKYIYTSLSGKHAPLGYGANFETITVDQIRYVKKQDAYLILAKVSDRHYVVDLDKAIKSGEIKSIKSSAD